VEGSHNKQSAKEAQARSLMDDHQAFNEIHNLQDKPEPNN
jgi:hypothetical protein